VTIADPEAFRLGVTFSSEAARDAEALAEVARQAADGRLRLTVAETLPLEEAPPHTRWWTPGTVAARSFCWWIELATTDGRTARQGRALAKSLYVRQVWPGWMVMGWQGRCVMVAVCSA
jgi:hypothetical protein